MTNNVFPVYENAEQEVDCSLSKADGSLAEARLYNMLRKQLPEHWSFIWGVQLGVHEYDFLVIVPGEGIVNIECKGHGYQHLPNHKFSWENNKTGEYETKDVMGQAASAGKYYIQYLQRSLFGIGYQWGIMGYCVIFPLDEFEGTNFAELPLYKASDCDEQNKGLVSIIQETLIRAKKNLRDRFGIEKPALLSVENAQRIWDFWTQDNGHRLLEREYAKIDLNDFKESMKNMLTISQNSLMQAIENSSSRHILIEGTAGTGKTILAKLAAEKLVGKNLYVCFNKVLARYTNLTFPDDSETVISHFHKLDEVLLGKNLDVEQKKDEDDVCFWTRFNQEMLSAARKLSPTERIKFDNIIVDEAQDLTEVQVRFLLRFCKTHGKFLLFSDLEQKLYPDRLTRYDFLKLFPDLETHWLNVNLRNTKNVAAYCKELLPADSALSRTDAILIGPKVVKKKICKEEINRFIRDEILTQYNPEDIAVLSPTHELLLNVTSACGITFCGPDSSIGKTDKNLTAWISGKASWKSTTSSFKGLEAMAIVHLVPVNYTLNSQLYVGGSRASRHLFIIEVE